MIWQRIARFFKRDHAGGGQAAKRARAEAELRLNVARGMWPQSQETRDLLAEWISTALRGHR